MATECPYRRAKRAFASLTVSDRVSDGRDEERVLKLDSVSMETVNLCRIE